MTSATLHEDAARRLRNFEKKYGRPALHLACHAAFAVAINPDLLNLLRINFFLDPPEQLPYAIEARLLLSPLCHEVEDLYRIDPDVRDLLLKRLETDFSQDRIYDVATLLWQYTERNAPWIHRQELECAQQLTALNFLAPEKALAWLDQQERRGAPANLSPQWFIAMRQGLERAIIEPENRAGPSQLLIAPSNLRELLLRLNYARQVAAFRRILTRDRFHAFLIHGAPRHGQHWVLQRLIHSVSELSGAAHIQVTLDESMSSRNYEQFNRALARQAGAPETIDASARNTWSPFVERIVTPLQTRAVVLVFDGVERVDAGRVGAIVSDLWGGMIAAHARDGFGERLPHYLVMFLVDNTGVTTAPGGVFADDTALPYVLRYVEQLPTLERFSADVLREWLMAVREQLSSVLTEDIETSISDLLANSDSGVPEQVFEYICTRSGVAWQEIETPGQPGHPDENPARAALRALVQKCNDVLELTGSGTDGWDALESIIAEIRGLLDEAFEPLAELIAGGTEGERLAAIVRLQQRPDPTHLQWLVERLAAEGPFLGQHAALALREAAARLNASFLQQVYEAITYAQIRLRPSASAVHINRILRQARLLLLERFPSEMRDELDSGPRTALLELGLRYDETRVAMPFSDERTQALERIATEMRSLAPVSPQLIAELSENSSAGARLAAVVLLQETPDPTFLPWLASRLGEERHFIGYHAAVALLIAAETLDAQYLELLEEAIRTARGGTRRSRDPNQRAMIDRAEGIVAHRRQRDPQALRAYRRRVEDTRGYLAGLAAEYQRLRQTMQEGWPRTGRMEQIAEQIRPHADEAYDLLPELVRSGSPGERLAAVVFLEARPHPLYLDWLVRRFEDDSAFIQWHAAVALLAAARQLPPADDAQVRAAIQSARERLGEGPGREDRRNKLLEAEELLDEAESDLNARSQGTDRSVEQRQQPNQENPTAQASKAALQEAIEEAARTTEVSDTGDVTRTTWKLWPNGSTLRIRFLDGDPIVQAKVEQYALEWTQYANLHFRFLPIGSTEEAEVRVSFKEAGTWSHVGTDGLNIPPDKPTVNFGWFTARTQDEEIRAIVLHEFGHVLGLIHEYQSPNSHIAWNREVVYRSLTGPPNRWSREQVDNVIFHRYQFDSPPDYRPFDPRSIMFNLPISREWTLDGFQVGINRDLSELDKAFVARLYPETTPEEER
jgi:inactive STAND